MIPRRTAFLVLVLLGVAAATLLLVIDTGGSEEPVLAPGGPPSEPEAAPSLPVLGNEDFAREGRRQVDAAPAMPVELGPEWSEPPDRGLDLHGIVLGPDEGPVPGAGVEIRHPSSRGVSTLDLAYLRESEVVGATRTNAEGEFRVRLEPGIPYDVQATAAGLVAPLLRDRQAGEFVVVRMSAPGALAGTLTREADGSPAAASVRLFRYGGAGGEIRTATDEKGRYRFDGLAEGEWVLEVQPEVLQPPPWTRVNIVPGEEVRQDFALSNGVLIRGTVTDAVTGDPIEGAEVAESWVFRRVVLTDAAGRYRLPGGGSPELGLRMHARADGYGRTNLQLESKAGPELTVDFQLHPARKARGRVVDAAGQPVRGAYVAAAASTWTEQGQSTDWPSTRSGGDGRFEIRNLRPDVAHALLLRRKGFATVIYEFPPEEMRLSVIELGEVLLPLSSVLAGVVVDGSGEPLPGIAVRLEGWNGDRGRFNPHRQEGLDSYVQQRNARTDDLGRFRFGDLAAGTYKIQVRMEGRPEMKPLEVELGPAEVREGLQLVLEYGLEFSGRIENPDGEPVATAFVELVPQNGEDRLWAMTRPEEDGSFRFRGLAPGVYDLGVQPLRGWGREQPKRALLRKEVPGVVAGTTGFRVVLPWAATITGRVVDAAGQPVRGSRVNAWDPLTGDTLASDSTDAEGAFHLVVAEGLLVDLEALEPPAPMQSGGGQDLNPPDWKPARARQSGVPAGASDLLLRLPREP